MTATMHFEASFSCGYKGTRRSAMIDARVCGALTYLPVSAFAGLLRTREHRGPSCTSASMRGRVLIAITNVACLPSYTVRTSANWSSTHDWFPGDTWHAVHWISGTPGVAPWAAVQSVAIGDGGRLAAFKWSSSPRARAMLLGTATCAYWKLRPSI